MSRSPHCRAKLFLNATWSPFVLNVKGELRTILAQFQRTSEVSYVAVRGHYLSQNGRHDMRRHKSNPPRLLTASDMTYILIIEYIR